MIHDGWIELLRDFFNLVDVFRLRDPADQTHGLFIDLFDRDHVVGVAAADFRLQIPYIAFYQNFEAIAATVLISTAI